MKIDGKQIDPSRIDAEYGRLMQIQQDRPEELKASEDEVRRLATINVVNRFLLRREARRQFPKVTEREITRRYDQIAKQQGSTFPLEPYREQIADDIRIDRLIRSVRDSVENPAAEEAQTVYESDPSAWRVPEQVHCSHIVRHTFGGADPSTALTQIMEAQRLLKSGQPFSAVAQRFSDRFGQAGDLGTFPRGQMVEKFDNVVFRMKPGELSDVFQTQFGYHIVLVHEQISAKERTFAEARADINRQLVEERREKAVLECVEKLRNDAVIEDDDQPEG